MTLLIAWSSVAASCAAIPAEIQPTVELGPNVKVPASWVRPVDRCMQAAGYIAESVEAPRTGANERYGYTWETSALIVWTSEIAPGGRLPQLDFLECRRQFDPYQPMTAEEIEATYRRWSLERLCLADFGYTTPEPPTLEEFRASWDTGPWTPVDGIRMPGDEARAACGLEMLGE